MTYNCANPDCSTAFDYREGRIYLFRQEDEKQAPQKPHAVKHFWLCRECAEIYTLEYRQSHGASLHFRRHAPKECLLGVSPQSARAAEVKPAQPQRVERVAPRRRKAANKRAPAASHLTLVTATLAAI